ncbi:hypothetical protein BC828DRAFT_409727 [Blastocladiella britannica]|nr:hypothetical protein BC828DRAFT_409727 [Blastocladiella britannica]
MTTERIAMVVLVRRMPPKFVIYCVGIAAVAAAGDALVSSMRGAIIMSSGFGCAHSYPPAVGIMDMGILIVTATYLLIGNALCLWKLQRMKTRSTRIMTVNETLTGAKSHMASTAGHAIVSTSFMSTRSNANSKEARIQRQFALRGVLSAIATLFIVVPMSALLNYWSLIDLPPPPSLELAALVLITLSNFADPVIVLSFDRKLRSAVSRALFPKWLRRSQALSLFFAVEGGN